MCCCPTPKLSPQGDCAFLLPQKNLYGFISVLKSGDNSPSPCNTCHTCVIVQIPGIICIRKRAHTHTHTHTHVCFCELWGHPIGVIFLYNCISYLPTPTLHLILHETLCSFRFSKNKQKQIHAVSTSTTFTL